MLSQNLSFLRTCFENVREGVLCGPAGQRRENFRPLLYSVLLVGN